MLISKTVEEEPYMDKIVFLVKLSLMPQDLLSAQKDHQEINIQDALLQKVSDYNLLKGQ